MRHFILLFPAFMASFVQLGRAQTVTFHQDIAPIIYNACTQCHRSGEIGPMPFTTYQEVAAHGNFIEYVTQTGYMPPWTPDHQYSTLRGERFLTEEEKELISAWVAGGMPEGNPMDNPGLPSYPEGSQVGQPDLVLGMSEAFVHQGNMVDQYQVFVIPTGVSEAKEIRAVEIRPGNNVVDHHALVAYTNDPAVIAQALAMDAADPNPGYESFGDYGVEVEQFLFGGWVPGTPPLEFPPTIGHVIEPGSHLLLQMHYGPSAAEAIDQTEINLFFHDEPIQREVETQIFGPETLDEFFYIPANEVKTFHASIPIQGDISLMSITPHCHLLGTAWEVFARSNDGQDTIPLISIPEWDFNWQGIFTFPQLVHIPDGYVVEAFATYDNTASNPSNPSSPPQPMTWGDFTTDEMFVLFLQGVAYEEGDEDITLSVPDRNTMLGYGQDNLFPAWPNPSAADALHIGFHLSQAGKVSLRLLDLNGREVKTWINATNMPSGHHLNAYDLSGLSTGTYVYQLETEHGGIRNAKLQVHHTP